MKLMQPPQINSAWGKLDRESGAWLDLVSHCADVAAVALALMRLPTWQGRLSACAGRKLTEHDMQRLAVLAFLHDVGKTSVGFWLKQCDQVLPNGAMDRSRRGALLSKIGGNLSQCGHVDECLTLFAPARFRTQLAAALPLQEIVQWQGLDLWRAAISHHGEPIAKMLNGRPADWTWHPAFGYDPFAQLAALGKRVRSWFPDAFVVGAPLPQNNAFVHAFAGLVSLADWIGSNPNASFFPYTLAPVDSRWAVAQARAAEVLQHMQLNPTLGRSDLRARAASFAQVFPFEPSPLQAQMARLDLGPLLIAEAETGSGKTEAALWRFKSLFAAGLVDGFSFTLPTRVSAVQIEKRAQAFLIAAFPDADLRPNLVLAVPGYLHSDGLDGKALAQFQVLWPDSELAASAHRHWAAENPKRFLAAAASVGTIDQALMSALQMRHAHLRGASLLRNLLIVDEVHASDVYMTSVLCVLLKRHLKAGGHALLLSATLGSSARDQFLNVLLDNIERQQLPANNIAPDLVPYPCLSVIGQPVIALAQPARQKQVFPQCIGIMKDAEAIAALAANSVRQGARVLIVRNTVQAVMEVQQALEAALGAGHPALFRCNGVVCPHHGRFAGVDRRVLDAAVELQFGKESSGGARVLVGSQTLEQSLDIDADLLITDLSPMDVLLQRIGRLHRHQRARAAGYETAQVWVLTPADRNLTPMLKRKPGNMGIGGVYENVAAIEATWQELLKCQALQPAAFSIPRDNRALVEACTQAEKLAELAQKLDPQWQNAGYALEGKDAARQGAAIVHALDWMDDEFAPFVSDQQIKTRIGDPTHLLRLVPPVISPFGQTISELQIPHWLWPKNCEETEVGVSADEEGFRFVLTAKTYFYSRLGLNTIVQQVIDL